MKTKLFSGTKPGYDPLEYAIQLRDDNIMQEVEQALSNKRVLLAYQPIMSTARPGRPVFWEGLARLRDAQGRILPAGEFMAAVEAHDIGRQIDCCALELGMAELRAHPALRLAINMSARSIGYPRWTQILERGLAIDPTVGERLILEITESSVLACGPQVGNFMANLHSKGISFALDDFGTGVNSLSYLKSLQVQRVKIDGSFVRDIVSNPRSEAMVRAVVQLASNLGVDCVAEFVADGAIYKRLVPLGVGYVQGYFIHEPEPLGHLLRSYSAAESQRIRHLSLGL
jgi:EAL domain-containing protein (putative c-di-GMP-specific phosphodiesterase class I)